MASDWDETWLLQSRYDALQMFSMAHLTGLSLGQVVIAGHCVRSDTNVCEVSQNRSPPDDAADTSGQLVVRGLTQDRSEHFMKP